MSHRRRLHINYRAFRKDGYRSIEAFERARAKAIAEDNAWRIGHEYSFDEEFPLTVVMYQEPEFASGAKPKVLDACGFDQSWIGNEQAAEQYIGPDMAMEEARRRGWWR